MAPVLQPFHLLAVILAGWANRHQQRVIEYLLEENRTFKQQMRKRKLHLTDAQRARLAVKGKALGRGVLNELANIVTPDAPTTIANILRRHGIEPAPERHTALKTFLRAQWE